MSTLCGSWNDKTAGRLRQPGTYMEPILWGVGGFQVSKMFLLGGRNSNIFNFHTYFGGNDPIWLIFFRWVVQRPSSLSICFYLHPWNLTWNLKRSAWKFGDSDLGNHYFQVPCDISGESWVVSHLRQRCHPGYHEKVVNKHQSRSCFIYIYYSDLSQVTPNGGVARESPKTPQQFRNLGILWIIL